MTTEESKERSPDHAEFFVVALPGLEDLVKAELLEWFPELEIKIEHGGVTVFAPLSQGLSMNMALKTPTRILLRMGNFTCSDFPKLFKKISSFPWREWVDPACEMQVHSSTARSRLKIKKRIEETALDGWRAYQKKSGHKVSRIKKAAMYVRLTDNLCTISLDTSGERLHKRGKRVLIGEAPLRETIAAALIQMVGRSHNASDKPVELIDPMMGSGTFLIEAATRDEIVGEREFGFDTFTAQPREEPQLKVTRPAIENLVGYEVDPKTLTAAQENLKGIRGVTVHKKDFFTAEPLPAANDRQRWVIVNPPYGERLKVKESLAEFYVKLFAAVERVVKPDRACFLLPAKVVHGKFQLPIGWKVLEKRRFLNGGIPVVAFVFGRNVV